MKNILVIDDEKEIVELIQIHLEEAGFRVICAYDGVEGLRQLKKQEIHVVILDIMMPGISGIRVCQKIREKYQIPIIMVSAKGTEQNKITGLHEGADDYMVKPFSPLELVARVESQLRRSGYLSEQKSTGSNQNLSVGDLVIRQPEHKVLRDGQALKLTPIEYKILVLLATNKGQVFSSEEIYKKIWEDKYFEGNNTVMAHMWRLREKIEVNPKEPAIIQTIWGVGYRIEED